MRRRPLLTALTAAIVGSAGCTGPGGAARRETTAPEPTTSTAPPPSTTVEPTGTTPDCPDTTATTATTADGSTPTVTFAALEPALVELVVDHYRLGSGGQFLVVDVTDDSASPPPRSAFSFRFDGTDHLPYEGDRIPKRRADGPNDRRYSQENGTGWIAFELPETGDPCGAALRWPGGEWRPGRRVRRRLHTPSPPLSLATWRVPSSVAVGDRVTFGFEVRNDGDEPGRFVGGIDATGWGPTRPVTLLSRRVPPGDTVSWTVPGEVVTDFGGARSEEIGDGADDVRYRLVSSAGSRRASVRVVAS